ncbi:chemotaxis response regulator protein-glutamate methylesterase [Fictibacillus phosphorivorans]|nr:chemotaxis response regulator protein-glutamate methylesterase [Fictibacillus phosphorivorans]MCM3717139.1 chemotaxis response regulator protein-glutamate methylesterase [Fictibacillus phosphorivorans]MCM3774826.1 chemotaxis response regulator protein-glutamate methylesterase [Fictibacillus phosphorivorans]
MRKLIKEFLSEDPRIDVLDTARNGQEAIEKILKLKPAVVTMDVEMPVLNGIEAVKKIMSVHPLPIIMLSSTTKEGAENTILAMEAGAIDFVAKPSGAISLDLHKVKTTLVEKVITSSKVKLKPVIHTSLKPNGSKPKQYIEKEEKDSLSKLVLIGTSTGGPRALQKVIPGLPGDIDAPIIVVQHMPPGFTQSLANRLDTLSEVKVKEAEQNERLKKGTVYIAPGGYHIRLVEKWGQAFLTIDQEPPVGGHRPSVNVLFESAAKLENFYKVAVIMTGMGSDGALGILALKNSSQTKVIAEAEESCIVYGMPKAAVLTKKVDEVVQLGSIASAIQYKL